MSGVTSSFDPPSRILLGPGPSNVHPRVTRAMTAPVLGYLDPAWFQTMDDTMALLRQVYGTSNSLTFPLSGTGSSGMEAILFNLLEPGDELIVGVNGFFGNRLLEMARRCGATAYPIRSEWGKEIEPGRVRFALGEHPKAKLVAIVHAETSTGVLQPIQQIGKLVRDHGALFVLDAVTSLGGTPVNADENLVDAAYSCTQKCLGCPPGLSPITISDRAWAAIEKRKSPVQTWYLDLALLAEYWTGGHTYHHTPPASMIYALREGLQIALEEGLEARYSRHARNGSALRAGLEAMGLELLAFDPHRLPVLTAVRAPDGINEAEIRAQLRDQYGVEIGGGLGPLRGQIWRIGLMGASSTAANVLLVLTALEATLRAAGAPVDPGAGPAAASRILVEATAG